MIEPYIISFAYVLRLIDVCEELEKQKIPVYRRELDELREALKSLLELRQGEPIGSWPEIRERLVEILWISLRIICG